MDTEDLNKLYDVIGERRKSWESIRAGEEHILCPKINDDDVKNYHSMAYHEDSSPTDGVAPSDPEKRQMEAVKSRIKTTMEYSVVLGLDEPTAGRWIPEFKQDLNAALSRCDQCIRNWHLHRLHLIADLRQQFVHEVAEITELRYDAFDAARITPGLKVIEEIIDAAPENSIITPHQIIRSHGGNVLLPVLESLCSLRYLSVSQHRTTFNKVFLRLQEKKVLKLGNAGVLPAMTRFLFDADPLRSKFARTGWNLLPGGEGFSALEWDWAVDGELTHQIHAVMAPTATTQMIQRFWRALSIIVTRMSQQLIDAKLVPANPESPESIYQLGMNHLSVDSVDVLEQIFRIYSILLTKSPAAFWSVFHRFARQGVAQSFATARCFPQLIAKDIHDAETGMPIGLCWLRPLMYSHKAPSQRAQMGEFLTPFFFLGLAKDPVWSKEPCVTFAATRGGIETLDAIMAAFRDPSYKINSKDSLLGINAAVNQTTRVLHGVVPLMLISPASDKGMKMPEAAARLLRSVLELDGIAFWTEWLALDSEHPAGIQTTNTRNSQKLWAVVLGEVKPGNYVTASVVLSSALRFLQTETLIAGKAKKLSTLQEQWNVTVEATAREVSRVIVRFCDFDRAHKTQVLSDPAAMRSITHALFNSNQDLNSAALEFIKSATEEDARDDALRKLLADHLPTFMEVYHKSVMYCIGEHLYWGPIPQILDLGRSTFTALCDPADGLLRAKVMNSAQQKAVSRWWQMQWVFIHKTLQETEAWSKKYSVEKRIWSDFVRDTMQFADDMLDQDAVFATAISAPNDQQSYERAMKSLLASVQRCTGLARMIRLRDAWLISVIVKILTKLLNRLHQYKMKPHPDVDRFIRETCVAIPGGPVKFVVNSNLLPAQRAQLTQALRIQVDEEEHDDVIFTGLSQATATPKQTTIEAWSKSSTFKIAEPSSGTSLTSATRKVTEELTPTASRISKSASVLEQMIARQQESARLKRKKAEEKARLTAAAKALEEKNKLKLQSDIKEKRRKEKEEAERAKRAAIEKARALRQPKLVPGEGSGLQAIRGKAPAPIPMKSDIMVSSDSELEEDNDSGIEELLSRSKVQAHSTALEPQPAPKPVTGPVRKTRIHRDEKSNRARISPPMDKLHAALLEWDIFHQGDEPPNARECTRVATQYHSPLDYKSTFHPLLIHEAWREFITSKAECTQKPFGLKVTTRISVDSFVEVCTVMPIMEAQERRLTQGDIVILSRGQDPLNDENAEHLIARIMETKVKHGSMDITFRVNRNPMSSLKPGRVNPGMELNGVKMTNMTTIEREFAALESLQHFDLCEEILRASPSPLLNFTPERLDETMENYQLNRGQASAVLNAAENDGFTLVQGPPGTGKTKTIVAMVGSLLTEVLHSAASVVSLSRTLPGAKGPPPTKKKLLVCAPSNAAVDELVLRLKNGVKTCKGQHMALNVLRLGRSEAMNAEVKDVSLDELVKRKMDGENNIGAALKEKDDLHGRAGMLKAKIAELKPTLESARAASNTNLEQEVQRQYDSIKSEQSKIGRQIDDLKSKASTRERDNKIRRTQFEQEFLDKAHVVCATLSSSGHHMFRDLKGIDFETVIIDEAAQCVELSALIPLKYGCIKCILVGDPKQLPPTVLSQAAQKYGYDQSLFVRMQQKHADRVHLLEVQYRMHPEISLFPSKEFYDSRLQNGGDMWDNRRRPWHQSLLMGPYRFFDVEGTQQAGRGGASLMNVAELDVAIKLYERFESEYGNHLNSRIGIITPYKAQLHLLRDRFASRFGQAISQRIEFNTTDAFQGRECEIIIFSCVRADPTLGIGFMTDIRRMNVGLTRAKSSLWVLGDSRALSRGRYWKRLIEDAQSRNVYAKGDLLRILSAPLEQARPEDLRPKARPTRPTITEDMGLREAAVAGHLPGLILDQTSALGLTPGTMTIQIQPSIQGLPKIQQTSSIASGPVPVRPGPSGAVAPMGITQKHVRAIFFFFLIQLRQIFRNADRTR